MRILEVLPTYPGEPFDGSAVYERNLNRALLERGAHIEVLTTRARRLSHRQHFSIAWPNELPTRDEHEGISIRRFDTIDPGRLGAAASAAVARRWSREDFTEGDVVSGSSRFTEVSVSQARRRPRRFDVLADFGRGPLAPRLIAKVMRDASQFDAVLVGYAPFSLPRQVLCALSRSKVPVALLPFIHENDRYHQFDSLLRTYEEAAAVFTLSSHTSAFLRRYAPRANPVTLGAGVTTVSTGSSAATEFRARHGLDHRRIILYVGRKEEGKRYELAVKAVDMLPQDAVLVMVGRDIDGKPIESDRVIQLGVLPDEELAAAYEACDIFILPSMFESFGMVFLDAWLRGKPVIGNLTCGVSAALIDNGVDGLLCRDAREIATAADQLLKDPGLSARLGAAGRAKTLAHYSWERVADRALEALHEITRPPSARVRDRERSGRLSAPGEKPSEASLEEVLASWGVGADDLLLKVAPRPQSRMKGVVVNEKQPEMSEPSPSSGRWDPIFYSGWDRVIPERSMWPGPNDSVAHFLRWPFEYLAYLTLLCGLKRSDSVLEIGCNHGRTMLALLDYLRPPGRYEGLDILPSHIAYAQDHIQTIAANFRFSHADIINDAYNPGGTLDASSFCFPYADSSFNCAYAASLYTHLLPDATANYLGETDRVLQQDGKALFSFFILDFYGGPGTSCDPLYEFDGRLEDCDGVGVRDVDTPGAVIAYERAYLETLAGEAGLRVTNVLPGYWSAQGDFAVNEQDLVVFEKVAR
jgi:glycosyltransferase involved in cell wall biosynthesis/SAM-dependent methyltransferase